MPASVGTRLVRTRSEGLSRPRRGAVLLWSGGDRGDRRGQRRQFPHRVGRARPAEHHPLDQIYPLLPGLDSGDEVLLPPEPLGQRALGQPGPPVRVAGLRTDRMGYHTAGQARANRCWAVRVQMVLSARGAGAAG